MCPVFGVGTYCRASEIPSCTNLAPRCVVAIPVKNEAERLPTCLAALADQRDRLGRLVKRQIFGIVVFANNCTDDSGHLATADTLRVRCAMNCRFP